GELTISESTTYRLYELDFRYKVFDRYNWDRGKKVTILTVKVTDDFMGEFHRQGLAREYDCVGSVRRRLTWRDGQNIASVQLATAHGERT
ncbi:MAG: hypothetical protein ABW321_16345, partial [Polyangiales bacterium]